MHNCDYSFFLFANQEFRRFFQNWTSVQKNIEIALELGMEYIFKKKLKMEVSNVSMTSLDGEGCYLQSE